MSEPTYIEKNGMRYTLNDIESSCWNELVTGSTQTKNPFHQPAFATNGEGEPEIRTVVLRKVLPESREIYIHTDMRSPKVANLQKNKRVSFLFYNFNERVQIRVSAIASLHIDDICADEAWMATGMNSRKTYMIDPGPGTELDFPSNGLDPEFINRDPTAEESKSGRKNFCLVISKVTSLEWLWLNSKGHRRAIFTYNQDDYLSKWLIP